MTEHRYSAPDTSDKLPEETWQGYWDRKMDERHGEDCECPVHQIRRVLEDHVTDCPCLVCSSNRYFKDMIQ